MKKIFFLILSALLLTGFFIPVSAASTGSTSDAAHSLMKSALIALALILGVLLLCCVLISIFYLKRKKDNDTPGKMLPLLILMYITTIIVLVCAIFCFAQYRNVQNQLNSSTAPSSMETSATSDPTTEPTTEATTEATTEPTTESTTEPTLPPFEPEKTESSDPKNWGISWDIISNGSVVNNYQRPEELIFEDGSVYTALEGITTFRGDNYRSGATYGTASVSSKKLSTLWQSSIGSFNTWTGAGWTGQPLVVRWDAETKAIMNLYEDKKAKTDLVEVIYATMDGNIHFFDLEDGSKTRDPIWMGMNFKGSGSLDPRGYPLLYVGSGALVPDGDYNGKIPRMYIVSLIDGSILYERSGYDSSAKRGWYAFDSAPLIDAETDTLIWPGESGVLYSFKLNSNFDKAAGTISIDPEITVKARYSTNTGRKIGWESSAIIVDRYLYFGDNGGMLFCVDLNTMELVWAQDTHDDINATPVFEWGEDGKGYLYTATSMEYGQGTTYIHKLDAATGEIIWEKTYDNVSFNSGVSGGVLSSPLLGKAGTSLEGMIIYPIGRTPQTDKGILVALDTATGNVVWEKTMNVYTWSSPTAVYTDSGDAYIVLCDAGGTMRLLDAATGDTYSSVELGSNVEASPVVFENTIVVGTRGQSVFGIKIN